MTLTMSIPCSSSMGDGGRCFQTAAAASFLPKWPQACEVQEDGKNYSINLNHLLIAGTSLFSKRKRDLSTSACFKRASSTLACIMLPHRDHRIQKWLQPYHSHQNLIPRIHFFCLPPTFESKGRRTAALHTDFAVNLKCLWPEAEKQMATLSI